MTEATNPQNELFGEYRTLEALNRAGSGEPDEVIESVKDSIEAFVGTADQFDDITMLCIKWNETRKR